MRVSSSTDDDGMFVAGSRLWAVIGSDVIRPHIQSNGRLAHTEKSKTISDKKEHRLLFLHPGSRHEEALAELTGKVSY